MAYLALVLVTSLLFQQPNSIEPLHRTIQIDNATYDAILTKPASPGRHPAVFVIGGLGCYSLDNLPHDHPYYQLLNGLTARGFVTMRVDKNGEGKSGARRVTRRSQTFNSPCAAPWPA